MIKLNFFTASFNLILICKLEKTIFEIILKNFHVIIEIIDIIFFTAEEMDEDLETTEELAQQIYSTNATLLGKGFALAAPPSISQALDGALPFR